MVQLTHEERQSNVELCRRFDLYLIQAGESDEGQEHAVARKEGDRSNYRMDKDCKILYVVTIILQRVAFWSTQGPSNPTHHQHRSLSD